MARRWVPVRTIASTAILVTMLGGPAGAQSPSVAPMSNASPAVPVQLGPIDWKPNTKGKDFATDPGAYAVGQLRDGRVVVLGTIGDATGQPIGAAWVSKDGSKWARLKLKAPKGSAITGIGTIDGTLVITGTAGAAAPVAGGLVWTSADGTSWSAAQPVDGPIYTVASIPDGLVGAGLVGDAATAWTTADGLTWSPTVLARPGRALHVLMGPDGTLVIAGALGEIQGDSSPAVWTSTDGGASWSQTILEGLLPGYWSIPAATITPFGYLVTLSELGQGGSIGHVWTSPDGTAWTETLVDPAGSLLAAGTVGTEALVIGHGQVLRSPDGVTWTATDEATFQGWSVRDVMVLADGRLFAAGDAFVGQTGSALATWTGTTASSE